MFGLFDWLPWRFRPFVRLGVRLTLDRLAEGDIDGMPTLTTEQREGIDRVGGRHFRAVLGEAQERFAADERAVKAMRAAADEGSDRPFLDWLFKDGGWRMIYGIVQVILLAFGIILPPLPPTP